MSVTVVYIWEYNFLQFSGKDSLQNPISESNLIIPVPVIIYDLLLNYNMLLADSCNLAMKNLDLFLTLISESKLIIPVINII